MKIKQQAPILVVRQRNKLDRLFFLSRLADEVGCSRLDNITKNQKFS